METLVKINGMPEQILTELLKKGYFKTKTEAFRAGLLELGKEYGVGGMRIPKELELELVALKLKQEQAEAKALGLKYETHEEVKKRYGFK